MSRSQMSQPQIDPRLEKLGLLQQLNPPQEDDTGNLVKMLAELYGIKEKQDTAAESSRLAGAHADYYTGLNDELHGSRAARSMQEELQGLDRAYAYSPGGVPGHIRDQVLQKYGYNVSPPIVAKPQDELGANSATTLPPAPSIASTPHRIGSAIGGYTKMLALPAYLDYKVGKNLYQHPEVIKRTAQDFLAGLQN